MTQQKEDMQRHCDVVHCIFEARSATHLPAEAEILELAIEERVTQRTRTAVVQISFGAQGVYNLHR